VSGSSTSSAFGSDAARWWDSSTRPGASAVPITTEQQVYSAMSFTGPGLRMKPGDYEFVLVCAGPGTLTLTVQTVSTDHGKIADHGETALDQQVECHDTDPRLDETTQLTLPKNSGFLITAVPDDQARNRAGWAYHLGAG